MIFEFLAENWRMKTWNKTNECSTNNLKFTCCCGWLWAAWIWFALAAPLRVLKCWVKVCCEFGVCNVYELVFASRWYVNWADTNEMHKSSPVHVNICCLNQKNKNCLYDKFIFKNRIEEFVDISLFLQIVQTYVFPLILFSYS